MATQLQIRRGTAAQVAAFTGAEGEIVYNSTNDSLHTNDGATAGGFELARADLNNVSDANLNAALTGNTVSALTITTLTATGGTINGTVIGGTTAAAGSFTTVNASGTLKSTASAEHHFYVGDNSNWSYIKNAGAATGTTQLGFYVSGATPDLLISGTGAASFSGVVTANAGVVVDNFTLDGTTLALSSGDLTLDVAGDIILDSGGFDVKLKVDGTEYAKFSNYQNNFYLEPVVQDKDLIIRGNDGGSVITALTLDMSAGGDAYFSKNIYATSATLTTANNEPQLTLISTDADALVGPQLNLWRNSGSAANGDLIGQITFTGEDSLSNTITYASIHGVADQVDNGAEDGSIRFSTRFNDVLAERLAITQTGGVTVNDTGIDADFRVESSGDVNMLFVDGGNDAVGIGTSAPASPLHILKAATGINAATTMLKLSSVDTNPAMYVGFQTQRDNSAGMGLNVLVTNVSGTVSEAMRIAPTGVSTFNGNTSILPTTDGDSFTVGKSTGAKLYFYNNASASLITNVANASTGRDGFQITNGNVITEIDTVSKLSVSAAEVVVNDTGADTEFRVESDTNANALYVDGATTNVGIGTGSPRAALEVSNGNGTHALGGNFDRVTTNAAVDILTVSGQATNCGVAIYARLVAAGAVGNEAAVIEFWAALTRQSGGADTATAVAPVVSKAIVGTAIGAGSLAWSGKTLQYTPACTTNYVGYQMEIQIAAQDSATITILP